MCAGFSIAGRQWKHFPSGPCEHFDVYTLIFFLSAGRQLMHLVNSPWWHLRGGRGYYGASSPGIDRREDWEIFEGDSDWKMDILLTFCGFLMHFWQVRFGLCLQVISFYSGLFLGGLAILLSIFYFSLGLASVFKQFRHFAFGPWLQLVACVSKSFVLAGETTFSLF